MMHAACPQGKAPPVQGQAACLSCYLIAIAYASTLNSFNTQAIPEIP